jgi:hypothetical protein
VVRMGETRNAYKNLEGKTCSWKTGWKVDGTSSVLRSMMGFGSSGTEPPGFVTIINGDPPGTTRLHEDRCVIMDV